MGDELPTFLFLRGVFIKPDEQSLEDQFERALDLLDSESGEFTESVEFSELPQMFTSLETWPSNPGFPCWHCEMKFDHKSVFVPKTIEPESSRIPIFGCFCGFPCLYAFAEYGIEPSKRIEKRKLIDVLYFMITGKRKKITPCKPRYEMSKYGGKMTTEEFVNMKEELDPEGLAILKKSIG